MGGGKGGSSTIGYKYYMGQHQSICHGPVDSVGPVYAGERIIKGVEASYSGGNVQRVFADSPDLFGGEKKEGGIQGDIDIMFGDDTQGQNDYLVSKVGVSSAYVPAFRGIVSAVCRKIYLTAMSPYPKPWWWTVTDIPQKSWFPETAEIYRAGDTFKGANPCHIIRDLLLSSAYGLGLSFTRLGDTEFHNVAQTLYDEKFSMSIIHSNPEKARELLRVILRHINGILYQDKSDGLIKIRLIRDDFDIDTIPVFDESNILALNEFQRPSFGELVNEIILKYRRRGEFDDSVAVFHDLASIQAQGGIISQEVQYPGIDDDIIAAQVGNRELRQQSTPIAQVKMTVNRDGWSLVPGDVIKWNWDALGVSGLALRIIKIDYGDPRAGRIILDCVEDIFGLGDTSYYTPTNPIWTDPIQDPITVQDARVDELNYYDLAVNFSSTPGFFAELESTDAYIHSQASPSAPTPGYELWNKISTASLYEFKASGEFTPSVSITENINETALTINVDNADAFELLDVNVGSYGYLGNEIIRLDSVDFDNNTVTIGRGCLDGPPLPHDSGERIWFTEGFTALDLTTWQSGNILDNKFLPRTGQGLFPIDDPEVVTATISLVSRHYKPYPPGNVVFTNGGSYPALLYDNGSVPATRMTWVNRNRLLQTTPGSLADFFDGNITPESNITYDIDFFQESNLHGTTPNRTYNVDSATNQTEWADEESDSTVYSFAIPNYEPDLDMPFYDSGIGGSLSSVSAAENITDTVFSDGMANISYGGYFDIGLFSLANYFAIVFDFTPDDLSPDRYQTLLSKVSSTGYFQEAIFYDRVLKTLAYSTAGSYNIPQPVSVAGRVVKGVPNRIIDININGIHQLYLNGLMLNSGAFYPAYTGYDWSLGASYTSGGARQYFFSGKIGNLRIYNNAGSVLSDFQGPIRKSRFLRADITSIRTEGGTPYRAFLPWTGIFRRTGWGNTWNQNYSGRI